MPQQIAQIEALLNTEQIDCLAIEPADSNSFTDIVQRAIDAGIPVFTVGVTSNGAEFSNFTQVPLEEGAFVADGVLAYAADNDIDAQVFTVSGGDPSQFWAQGRMEGFQTAHPRGDPRRRVHQHLRQRPHALRTTRPARSTRTRPSSPATPRST